MYMGCRGHSSWQLGSLLGFELVLLKNNFFMGGGGCLVRATEGCVEEGSYVDVHTWTG